jgi:hypothetical protein
MVTDKMGNSHDEPLRFRREELLPDRRRQPPAAHSLRFGTAVNIALQVGQFELADRETFPQSDDQVLEVQSDPLDGARFERVKMR